MRKLSDIIIKSIKATALPQVQHNEIFRQLTTRAYIENYSVNGKRCLGVIFDTQEDDNISLLEKFCEKTLLEFCFITIPWGDGLKHMLIHPILNWKPKCLSNVQSVNDLQRGETPLSL